jgi:hypothetical protein
MNEDELIGKAREHLKTTLRDHPLPGLAENTFTKASLSKAPMVIFEAEHREDTIKIVFDEKRFIRDVTLFPKNRS